MLAAELLKAPLGKAGLEDAVHAAVEVVTHCMPVATAMLCGLTCRLDELPKTAYAAHAVQVGNGGQQ